MLQLSSMFANKAVMSLRTGTAIAHLGQPIINPDNLKIEGFYCEDSVSKEKLVLLYQDIREILPQGMVVDDIDILAHPQDLVRLKDLLDMNFQLIGKPVETVETKEKVGKVSDFATEIETMYVQKLYVTRTMFKSLTSGQLSVDRNNVVEVTNKRVIINELLQGAPATVNAGLA